MNSDSQTMFKKINPAALWLIFTAALIALFSLFPISGDDWQWATERYFPTFNGRYLGNLTAMLITSQLWLKPIVSGFAVSGIVYLAAELTGSRRTAVIAAPLMLLLPTAVFTQVYVWGAGFANYTVPIFFILLTGFVIKKGRAAAGPLGLIAAFLSAAAAQLFVENVTIAMVVFYVVLFTYSIKKKLSGRSLILAALLGSIAGALIMLSNPCYYGDVAGAHSIPSLADMLSNIKENYLWGVAPFLVTNNLALNLVLCTLMVLLIYKSKPELKTPDKLLIFFFGLVGAYSVMRTIYPAIIWSAYIRAGEGLIAAAFLAALIYSLLRYVKPGKRKTQLIFIIIAAALINAPLFVLQPIGPRCFFISYVLLILIGANVYLYLREELSLRIKSQFPVRAAYACVLLGVYLTLFFTYGYTALAIRNREAVMREQLAEGNTTISVMSLPYPEYVWQGDPTNPYVELIFKNYYGIPQEYTLEMS